MAKPEKLDTFEIVWLRGNRRKVITVEALDEQRAIKLGAAALARTNLDHFRMHGRPRRIG